MKVDAGFRNGVEARKVHDGILAIVSDDGGFTAVRPTNENLNQHAVRPLTQWLIQAAKNRSSITYGTAKTRLENEIGFNPLPRATRVGYPAGTLMSRMLAAELRCPLLNVLLVLEKDRLPSDGAGSFMAKYLDDERLAIKGFRKTNPQDWQWACDRIVTDVYAFKEWDRVYEKTFGEQLPEPTPAPRSNEKDGIRYARRGEGPNHQALRLWVREHPQAIRRAYASFRTDTEVVLDSADRVDVVYYGPNLTVVIEVKSRDSDDNDLRRGIFQCIKYRAVKKAMDIRNEARVEALLVTEGKLSGELKSLLRLHKIKHFVKAP